LQITKLEYTRRAGRVNIYIDSKYSFTCFEKFVVDFGFYKGAEITLEKIDEVKAKDIAEKLFSKAEKKLAKAVLTVRQTRMFLDREVRKLSEDEQHLLSSNYQDGILERLSSLGLLDDVAYCRKILENKESTKSPYEIRKYLLSKGIKNKVVEQVLGKLEYDCEAQIKKHIEKKLRILEGKKIGKEELKNKLYRSLVQRGFKFSQFRSLIDLYLK
jgi:regulatory protein